MPALGSGFVSPGSQGRIWEGWLSQINVSSVKKKQEWRGILDLESTVSTMPRLVFLFLVLICCPAHMHSICSAFFRVPLRRQSPVPSYSLLARLPTSYRLLKPVLPPVITLTAWNFDYSLLFPIFPECVISTDDEDCVLYV